MMNEQDRTRIAELQAGQAIVERNVAEHERDVIAGVALNEAANREVAQADAVDARISANQNAVAAQEMATERNLMHGNLAAERHASANNAFGFYLMTAVVLMMLLGGGIYFYFQKRDAANAAPPNSTITVNNGTLPAGGAGATRR
jgi:hypothetical protein